MTDVPRIAEVAPPFVLVDSLEQFCVGAEHQALTLFPGAGKQLPVRVHALRGARIGGGGLVSLDGGLFRTDDTVPGYYRDMRPVWYWGLMASDAKVVNVDVPVAIGIEPNWVYGHVLLEMMPKLFLLNFLKQLGMDFAIALPQHAPIFFRDLIDIFVPGGRVVEYDAVTQVISAPFALVPSMMNRGYEYHPAFKMMVSELKANCRGSLRAKSPSRVFLSRRKLSQMYDQRIAGADLVEDMFRRHGFVVIHPETMSFREQVDLYAGVQVLAGAAGSGLHNSVFLPPGATVISLGFRNELQEKRCRFFAQNLHIVEAPSVTTTVKGSVEFQKTISRLEEKVTDALLPIDAWVSAGDGALNRRPDFMSVERQDEWNWLTSILMSSDLNVFWPLGSETGVSAQRSSRYGTSST
jgi:capsular polysaccharide biosynthesis protein